MKLRKLIITCTFLLIPLFNSFSEEKLNKQKDMLTVSVSGMVCTSCERDIEQTFEAKKEVKSVDAIFDEKAIKLVFKEGMQLTNEEIGNIVADLGYKVTAIK